MADDVTKKDFQSLQGWVNAELKKRDTAIDKKADKNELASLRAADDLAAKLTKLENTTKSNYRLIEDLEKQMDKLMQRIQKLEDK